MHTRCEKNFVNEIMKMFVTYNLHKPQSVHEIVQTDSYDEKLCLH